MQWWQRNYKQLLLSIVGISFLISSISKFLQVINSTNEPLSFLFFAISGFIFFGIIFILNFLKNESFKEISDIITTAFIFTFSCTLMRILIRQDIDALNFLSSPYFWYEYFLILTLFCLLNFFKFNALKILSLTLIPLNIISGLKQYFTGYPLYPYDFKLTVEGIKGLSVFVTNMSYLIYTVAIIILFVWIIKRTLKSHQYNNNPLAFVGLSSALLCSIFFVYNQQKIELLKSNHISIFQASFLKNHNFVLSDLILRSSLEKVNLPENYSEINEYLYAAHDENDKPKLISKNKVNVIVVASNSFNNITFNNANILSNYKKLCEKTLCGSVIFSNFSDNTANNEFELLTSLSTALMPAGIIPFKTSHTPNSNIEWLNDLGFNTSVAFTSQTYNRQKNYEKLGFKILTPLENIAELRTHILKNISANKKSQSDFMFISYDKAMDYLNYDNSARDKENSLVFLRTTAANDLLLEELTLVLSKTKEKYVLLYLGMPNYKLSKSLYDYDKGIEPVLYQAPFIVWTNFGKPQKMRRIIGANFMLPNLFEYLALPQRGFHKYLAYLSKNLYAFTESFAWTPTGIKNIFDANVNLNALLTLQYDLFFGQKYANQRFFDDKEIGTDTCPVTWK
jgi:hypothetical protein